MQISDSKWKKIIETQFPTDKFIKLVSAVNNNVNSVEKIASLDNIQIKNVFINTIKEFLDGSLNLDELANIANMLYGVVIKRSETQSDLKAAIYAAAELSYYIRIVEKDTNTLVNFRNKVIEYFNQNS